MTEQIPDKIRVSAISINTLQSPGNVKENFEKIVTHINRAHNLGAQLMLTPELVLDGMFVYQIRPYLSAVAKKQKEITQLKNAYIDLAQTIKRTYFPKFSELSRALQIYIALGTAEYYDGGVYNSILLFSPNGKIVARYRKVNALFEVATKEHHSFDIFHTPIGSIGGMICADFGMTESWRIQKLKGAKLVLWSSGDFSLPIIIKKSLCTHAYQNGYYILASNHGGGMIIDPDGQIITETNESDELVTSSIDYQKTNFKGLCFSRDIGAYAPLIDESLQRIAEEGCQTRMENDYKEQRHVIENPNHVEDAISKIKV